ncbi:MAG: DEAD/DEAH box helicase, partial [Nocardioidaceae bacterium]|nr:DEAD/DEAH box helicase [Nocardioidaceae bacterium]
MSSHDQSTAPSFAALGVPAALADVLTTQGITSPFPIQASTLPDSLGGRDVLGRGRTGSGKTLAFALPTVARLRESGRKRQPGKPRALILVPTRELATQVHETLAPLADAVGQRSTIVIGGVGINPQINKMRAGVDVVVATPGRLEDLIRQGHCRLDQVEVSVLDEADHMADLGFLPAVRRLLDLTPARSQRLLFSATLDRGVDVLVKRFLHDPVVHEVDEETSHVPTMEHHVVTVDAGTKAQVVNALLSGTVRTLAFTRTKHAAKALARKLNASGIPAVDLHGNLSQNARQRNLSLFESGEVGVLVATDIAARGIHVDDVGLVVHVDPPTEHKAYLHRSGRTARAGAEGRVVTVGLRNQSRELDQLMRRAGIKPQVLPPHPNADAFTRLTGPAREKVDPATLVAQPTSNGGGNGQRRGGGGQRGNAPRSDDGGTARAPRNR